VRRGKGRPHAGRVVDRQQELALYAGELRRELVEVAAAEHVLAVVLLATPIGRIEIEQHAGAIVPPDELAIPQLLNPQASKAFVNASE
jgi:hypothetical protein